MDMLMTAEEGKKKLTDIVEEIKTCMFTTTDEGCNVFSRPMVTIRLDNEGNLWFFTCEDSEKIKDMSHDRQVTLVYSHPGKNTYMNVYGSCTVNNDKNKMNELWLPSLRSWFPQGLEDPPVPLKSIDRRSIVLGQFFGRYDQPLKKRTGYSRFKNVRRRSDDTAAFPLVNYSTKLMVNWVPVLIPDRTSILALCD
jgi:general stress protein 26